MRKRWKITEEKCCVTSKPTGILEASGITRLTTPLVILPLLFWFLSHQPDRTMWSMALPPGMYTVSLCVAWTTLNHTLNFTSPLQQVSWSTSGGTSFVQLCVVFYVVIFLVIDGLSKMSFFIGPFIEIIYLIVFLCLIDVSGQTWYLFCKRQITYSIMLSNMWKQPINHL